MRTTQPDFVAYAENRGNGFGLKNIWQWGALQMLCLIDTGNAEVQATYGGGVGSGKVAGSGSAWRGIYDLWGCYNEFCLGIETEAPHLFLCTDAGDNSLESVANPIPYVSNVSISKMSAEYARQGLFLPMQAQSNVLTWGGDHVYYYDSYRNSCSTGSPSGLNTNAGLFYINFSIRGAGSAIAARLSRPVGE